MAVASLVLYAVNDLACIAMSVTAVLFAIFAAKDRNVTQKALQPALMLGTVYGLRGVLALIINTIQNFGLMGDSYYSSGLYDNINAFNRIFGIICYIAIFVYLVVTIVLFSLKKDVPLFGTLSTKIVGDEKE